MEGFGRPFFSFRDPERRTTAYVRHLISRRTYVRPHESTRRGLRLEIRWRPRRGQEGVVHGKECEAAFSQVETLQCSAPVYARGSTRACRTVAPASSRPRAS